MQDLIVPGVLDEIGPANILVPCSEIHERAWHLKTPAGQSLEKLVACLGNVEITHNNQIMILNELVRKSCVDPIR